MRRRWQQPCPSWTRAHAPGLPYRARGCDNNGRMNFISDPFREPRNQDAVMKCEFQGENVPMILRHEEVRKAAKDWRTFSSNAPFRVPIPSEEDVRTMRQLPVETEERYQRVVGYETLTVKFSPR